LSILRDAAKGQPAWLHPWFGFWSALVAAHAGFFWIATALVESLIALAVILGLGRKVTYWVGIVFSLLVWSTAEGFGGPYSAGATDIGTGVIYAVVFAALLAVNASAGTSRHSLDQVTLATRWRPSGLPRAATGSGRPLPPPPRPRSARRRPGRQGPRSLDQREAALFDRLYNAEGAEHRDFCEVFGPEKIPDCFSEFLGWFMIRHVMAGTELMRAAGTVTKRLAAWLGEQGYISADAAAGGVAEGAEAARNLPRAERLAQQLHAFCENEPTGRCDDQEEGHFTITRVEPGRIWLESMAGDTYGPVDLPRGLSERCQEGWDLSGVVAERRGRWYLVDGWNVYP
jgi:uncharacterized membrane protein YphA (DoxX/SURF4 family)